MSESTLDWIKKIPGDLVAFDEVPLFGTPPPFPWDKFNQELSNTFPGTTVTASEPKWVSEEDLFSTLGSPLKFLTMTVASHEGKLYWAIAEEELSALMRALIGQATPNLDYLDGFHHFLGLEAINAVRSAQFDSRLSVQLLREGEKPTGQALTFDITIHVDDKTFVGRLFMNQELRKSLKNFYHKDGENALFNSDLAEKINVFASIEVGNTSITKKEWATVSIGDFLILDHCTFKPGETKGATGLISSETFGAKPRPCEVCSLSIAIAMDNEQTSQGRRLQPERLDEIKPVATRGRVMFTYKSKPLFIAKLQEDGKIKLSERPLYNEVNMPKDDPEDDFEEEFDEEEEDFEEEDEDFEEDEISEETEDKAKAETPQPEATIVASEEKKEVKDPDDIPLNVIVELARVQMSFKTLMNLQPGNILDLNIEPAKGVDLIVNGTRIAKGELLQVGETLGVRILEK